MAINCRICHAELDALASGRCRKCRQLVCPACVGTGAADSLGGMLCSVCEMTEPLLTTDAEHATQTTTGDGADSADSPDDKKESPPALPNRFPGLWTWMGFGGVLGLIFVGIVAFPILQVRYHAGVVRDGTEAAATVAANSLVRIGNRRAVQALMTISRDERSRNRAVAIQALGYCTDSRVEKLLQNIKAENRLPPALRLIVDEALIRHDAHPVSKDERETKTQPE